MKKVALKDMDIRKDDSILSVYLKCEKCSYVYDATEDTEISKSVCEKCISLMASKRDETKVSSSEGQRNEVPSSENLDYTEQSSDTKKYTSKANLLVYTAHSDPKVAKKQFKTLPSSGYSSLLPYQIPQVREVLSSIFQETPTYIIDASAHIGGDTIHFAKIWPLCKITSIDIDENAIKCLKANVATFATNPDNVEIISADSTEWIVTQRRKADFYYFDPPWGGPDYCSADEISLYLSGKPIAELINFVLDQNLTFRVILKAPRNFAYPAFKKEVHGTTNLHYIRKPQKRGSIAYALILISKN